MSPDTVTRDRPAFVWGYNNNGGLGLGHAARIHLPTPTQLPANTIDVHGGVDFSLALTSSGDVYAWGSNEFGQVGDGTAISRRTPTRVQLPKNARITAIAAGTDHALALTSSGDVLTWGRNHHGQIGNGTKDAQGVPTVVHSGPVRALAAGDATSIAIGRHGELLTWGRNGSGQLAITSRGVGAALDPVLVPTSALLPKGAKAAMADAGRRHLIVLTEDGTVLGFGVDATGKPMPARLPLNPSWGRVRSICSGDDFTLALTDRHVLLAWGSNRSGQLGVGDTAFRAEPTVVRLPRANGHVTAVQAGARSAVAITSESEIFTWGETRLGQSGLGRLTQTHAKPQRVTSLDGAAVIGLHGGLHHFVVTAKHGPAAGLRLTPAVTTVPAGEPVTYRVHLVDSFGIDLGPVPHGKNVSLRITDGQAVGTTVRAHTPGPHQVTAHTGRLTGTATLIVKNGK